MSRRSGFDPRDMFALLKEYDSWKDEIKNKLGDKKEKKDPDKWSTTDYMMFNLTVQLPVIIFGSCYMMNQIIKLAEVLHK